MNATVVAPATQITEGTQVVTVGRYGPNTANCGHGITRPINCTKVYEARARKSDGRLTWRLVHECNDATAGYVSGAMIARAKAYAESRGLEFYRHVTHGSPAC